MIFFRTAIPDGFEEHLPTLISHTMFLARAPLSLNEEKPTPPKYKHTRIANLKTLHIRCVCV